MEVDGGNTADRTRIIVTVCIGPHSNEKNTALFHRVFHPRQRAQALLRLRRGLSRNPLTLQAAAVLTLAAFTVIDARATGKRGVSPTVATGADTRLLVIAP